MISHSSDTDDLIACAIKYGEGKQHLNWCSFTWVGLANLINYYLEREHKFEFAEPEGSSICPLCGVDNPHQHTPLEQVIYTNGIKRGRAALKEHDAKVLESAARCCEKIAYERFAEYGSTEADTGATYYTGNDTDDHETRDDEDSVCATAIRRMAEERRKL